MRKWLKRTGITLLTVFIIFNIICASQAYYFTHFYSGLIQTPVQQMGFFEKTGKALLGQKYAKSKVVDSLKINHDRITLKTKDGLTLAGWYAGKKIVDTSVQPKGTIIMFHGHGNSRSDIIEEAEEFSNLGYNVFMIDFRAHGESEGNICTVGYREVEDVKAAYEYIAKKGEKNIILWGVSLGASTITKAIYDYTEIKPLKIILEMPFGTMLDAAEGRVRVMNLPEEPISMFLTFWGGAEQGFWAFGLKPEEYVKKITCPVLLQWGREDPRVTERETDIIYANLASSNKILVKYDNSGHESLCKKENTKWTRNITAFLGQ